MRALNHLFSSAFVTLTLTTSVFAADNVMISEYLLYFGLFLFQGYGHSGHSDTPDIAPKLVERLRTEIAMSDGQARVVSMERKKRAVSMERKKRVASM